MRRLDVFRFPHPAATATGRCTSLTGTARGRGVLVFSDAGGARETFRQMGDRLASTGYVALIPDIRYRAGEWAPFDVAIGVHGQAGGGPADRPYEHAHQ